MATTTTTAEPPQKVVLEYVLPTMAVVCAVAAPCLTFGFLVGAARLGQELTSAVVKPLSFLSFLVIALSIAFLLSNYLVNMTMLLYAVYSVLLAVANLIADRLAKKRVWPVLWLWHAVNLINLLGGTAGLLVPYAVNRNNDGVIAAALRASPLASQDRLGCPEAPLEGVVWCDNGWVAIQTIIAFLYVVVHALAFLVVTVRVASHYGGDSTGPEEAQGFRQGSYDRPSAPSGGGPF